MKYYSLNDRSHKTNFEGAILRGLAPDKGLYFPSEIKPLPSSFLRGFHKRSKEEIAFEVIKNFVGDEIPENELREIVAATVDFDFPVVKLKDNIGALELFHGPTLAFKDVGARFMAGSLGYFIKRDQLGKITVLVATSGDTGGAVANGFLGVEGIDVVILYPRGKVSEIQEKQLTLGQNISALEVEGGFDDCQEMVKRAFLDKNLQKHITLTSANSINVARWLPQMFYYFFAVQQLIEEKRKLVFAVPSGNFGNICAGLLAKKIGIPVSHFVAASNSNNVVERYFQSQKFEPRESVQTLSNAMDVGNPSNFIRVLELFQQEFKDLQDNLSSFSFDDEQTLRAIKELHREVNYILDPHGAVGYLGLKKYLQDNAEFYGLFLETAHPVKFLGTVEKAIGEQIEIPGSIRELMEQEKKVVGIETYEDLTEFLLR